MEKLIDDKRRGHEIVTKAQPPAPTEVSGLPEALQRSISTARSGGDRLDRQARNDPAISPVIKA